MISFLKAKLKRKTPVQVVPKPDFTEIARLRVEASAIHGTLMAMPVHHPDRLQVVQAMSMNHIALMHLETMIGVSYNSILKRYEQLEALCTPGSECSATCRCLNI